MGPATLTCAAGLWAVGTLVGPARAASSWDSYLRLCIAERNLQTQPTPAEEEAAAADVQRFIIQSMIDNLERVVALQPGNGTAHLRLASNYLRQFEEFQTRGANQMTVAQIRDAALASRFASADELRAWLTRAFGANSELLYRAHHHARCALQLSPLEGDGYLLLANLCFLEGKSSAAVEALVSQALVVRPYDGDVLYLAGKQLLLSRPDEALKLWAAAFQLAGGQQRQIIRLMAGRVPAKSFLEVIQPDWEQLYAIWTRYREVGAEEDWRAIEQYARQRAPLDAAQQPPELAVRIWLRLGMMQRELGLHAEAVESLSKGNAVYQNYFPIRHHLGLALMDAQQPDAAEPHLRWCLSRRPDYADVRDALKLATKMRLAQANRPLSVVHRPFPDTADH
jgi:tetratricopeptide (TPR) repeat protein